MDFTLTFAEETFAHLTAHLFSGAMTERAAYLLCGVSVSPLETRLLVRSVMPVETDDVLSASPVHMSITSRSYVRALKMAADTRSSFVFVHSHPGGSPKHSTQDDIEERALFRTAYTRIRHDSMHGSLVLSGADAISGRVWFADGTTKPISRCRVLGRRFRFLDAEVGGQQTPAFADRQVRAFGPDIQLLLQRLTVGVVGVGGTGSAVVEQLARLGVGRFVVSDGQTLESSNINRVYGSRSSDAGSAKTAIVERSLTELGLGTKLTALSRPISYSSVLAQFRDCDVIFGCTDDEFSRSLLTRLSVYYLIPVFDMGVQIESHDQTIRGVEGRVTTLFPGNACLFCRGRISAAGVAAQARLEIDPDGAAQLRAEGYAPELQDPAPSVIGFTTAVAATAVNEFLHRLTGYLGSDRTSNEVIHRFSDSRLSTNSRPPTEGCFCADPKYFARGDVPLFLDTRWRAEQ